MARGRFLNRSICLSLKFDVLPDDTCRLMATWLISQLDHRGVFYGDAAAVKSLIFPLKQEITTNQVKLYLNEMEYAGLIRLFESGGRWWQWWPGFTHNQPRLKAYRERSEFPAPPIDPAELRNELMLLKSMPYAGYLQTAHWQRLRMQVLERAKYMCEGCGTKVHLDIHHKTYSRRGEEELDDLMALCRNCHTGRHNKSTHGGQR